MRSLFAVCVALIGTALLAGCSKPAPPPPDGTSGIRGVCLLPAKPADEDGVIPERDCWAGCGVLVHHTNHSSSDPTWGLEYRATADAEGKFQLALNPGHYLIYPQDRERLKDMAITGEYVEVEAGKFTEVVIDYDKVQMTRVRLKQK